MATSTRQVDFVTGVETSEAPTAGTPTNPNDLVTLDYADKNYQQGTAKRDTIGDIKAIIADDRKDGDLVFNQATNEEYYFDSVSAATGDDDFVLVPDAGTGRWLKRGILNKKVDFIDTTTSTTPTSGAATFAGGVGVAENLNVGGNAVITGDLTVSGTTTTVDTDNLTVTDPNIVLNDGGNQATANANKSGITVEMSDATDVVVGYDSSLASRFKAGDSGAESEIITAANDQSLTGLKEFTRETEHTEITTPAGNPAAGKRKMYFKNDGNLYVKSSAGSENVLGSAVSNANLQRLGIENYVANHNFETDISGWNTYDDGSVAAPVDGTGDAGNLVLTSNEETVSPLRGNKTLRLDKPASDAQGNGISVDLNPLAVADKNKVLRLNLDVRTSGSFSGGDFTVYLRNIDSPANTLLGSIPASGAGETLGFNVPDTVAAGDENLRLIFHVATTNASAYSVFIDNVFLGNGLNEADEDQLGLISFYKTFSEAGDNNFTAGDIYVTRNGNICTVSWVGLTHASDSSPQTTAAFLPSWATPSDTTRGVYDSGTNGTQGVVVFSSGIFQTRYHDTSFALDNRTSAVDGSFSYLVGL